MSKKDTSEARFKALEERIAQLEKLERRRAEESRIWQARFRTSQRDLEKAEGIISLQAARIVELERENEKLKARIAWLEKQLFGTKAETTESFSEEPTVILSEVVLPRKRGKQPGALGHGRKLRLELPVETIDHDVEADKRHCDCCGAAYVLLSEPEVSEEIHRSVKLVRRRHRRMKYVRSCRCPGTTTFLTAECPPKLLPKGMLSVEMWSFILLSKYLLQMPLNRVRKSLALDGLELSQGMLTNGLKKLARLFVIPYTLIKARNQNAKHWQMDETHWKVFVDIEGKENHNWWLWVSVTDDTRLFVLDKSRSSQVPLALLKESSHGILTTDRYSAYQKLPESIKHTYCWAHVRRDFLQLRDGYPKLAPLAQSWVERIDDLFLQNRVRLACLNNADYFEVEEQKLRTLLTTMKEAWNGHLADTKLHPQARKVFKSLAKFWDGLTVFADLPAIPMDNNRSERSLRNPVVGRKNYYGSGALWSGYMAACLFSIFQTLEANNLDPSSWLTEYLHACANNRGRPPTNVKDFLPWSLSPQLATHLSRSKSPPAGV